MPSFTSQPSSALAIDQIPARGSELQALTGLRFFAAAVVVLSHMAYYFPSVFSAQIFNSLPLAQGVSFFFVLSGFILTYVYPRLNSAGATAQFFRARFARIYPAYLLALVICLWAIPLGQFIAHGAPLSGLIVANLLVIHDWIADPQWYCSINAPSWSVSTEVFFYLLFPLLISRFEMNWPWKLLASALLVAICVSICAHLNQPETALQGFSVRGLIYYNPLCRLFEFVVGMSTAVVWRKAQNAV
jgi:peptidoglycan/LPS O-acetylase OafA/YrhL